MADQQNPDPLKSAATELLAAITKVVNSGAAAIESLAGEAVRGSGVIIEKHYDFAGFTRVDIGSAFVGKVRQGAAWSVVVFADDNVFDHIIVAVEEKTLRIRLEGYRINATRLRAEVTMPSIEALAAGGASQVTMDGFLRVPAFVALLTGASHLNGEANADALTVQVAGASQATLRGAASVLTVTASGASSANLTDLIVESADVKASGASQVSINASRSIEVTASGASSMRYSGGATVASSKLSGGSHIKQV